MEGCAEGAVVRSALVSSLSDLGEKITNIVSKVQDNFRASTDLYEFIRLGNKNGITALFGVSHAYSDCMKTLGVRTKAELEQLWKKCYREAEVRDAVEMVLEGEQAFAEFVAEVEKELIPYEDKSISKGPAMAGQVLPKDLGLFDATSGQPVTLDTYWKESKFTLFVLIRHFG